MAAIPPRACVVVVTGAESTGKSTLAAALSAELRAPLSLEHARAYAESLGRPLVVGDVERIARGQRRNEDEAMGRAAGGVVILDTDLRSTLVYARFYYAGAPSWLESEVATRVPALYLLCGTDVAWVPDPVRDRPQEREAIQRAISSSIRSTGASVVVEVRGTAAQRLDAARAAISAFTE